MNYEQFVETMYQMCKEMIHDSEIVEKQQILKNNGVYMNGLSIRKKEQAVAPIIYLDRLYARYLEGETIGQLCILLIEKCRNAPNPPVDEYEKILDLSCVQSCTVYKLINREQNQELLQNIPHLPMMDLAIVFYLLLSVDEQKSCSVLIRNEHLRQWKIPISVLYEYARKNTPRLLPPVFGPLEDRFPEVFFDTEERIPLYLLTNEVGINGAAVLLYEQMPKWIYEQLGDSYYLLPSSIHEFLLIPAADAPKPAQLCAIVREINATQVEKEERLSDEIYYFDGRIVTKM